MPPQAVTPPRDHFYALDAMRGIAALMVVCLHEYQAFPGLPQPFSGYLAVDLFFLLSGYVVASAYDRHLASDMSFGTFLKLRLVRLYPLYFIGFAIGLTRALAQVLAGIQPLPTDTFVLGALMEFTILPTPMTIGWPHDALFFLNPPAWSLFFELLINAFFAAFHRHLSQRVLIALLIVSGSSLIYVASEYHSLNMGNYWHTVIMCVPRVAFPFLMGIFIFKHLPRLPNLPSFWAWPLSLLIVPLLAWNPTGYRVAYDLILAMGAFPIIVTVGAAIRTRGLTTRASKLAGEISYAIYIVHVPTLAMMATIYRRIGAGWGQPPYVGPLIILLATLLALALDRFYDKPVRTWLSRLVMPQRVMSERPA